MLQVLTSLTRSTAFWTVGKGSHLCIADSDSDSRRISYHFAAARDPVNSAATLPVFRFRLLLPDSLVPTLHYAYHKGTSLITSSTELTNELFQVRTSPHLMFECLLQLSNQQPSGVRAKIQRTSSINQ